MNKQLLKLRLLLHLDTTRHFVSQKLQTLGAALSSSTMTTWAAYSFCVHASPASTPEHPATAAGPGRGTCFHPGHELGLLMPMEPQLSPGPWEGPRSLTRAREASADAVQRAPTPRVLHLPGQLGSPVTSARAARARSGTALELRGRTLPGAWEQRGRGSAARNCLQQGK